MRVVSQLWQVSDGSLLGVFRGHRRGVWSVKFSPVDQVGNVVALPPFQNDINYLID